MSKDKRRLDNFGGGGLVRKIGRKLGPIPSAMRTLQKVATKRRLHGICIFKRHYSLKHVKYHV